MKRRTVLYFCIGALCFLISFIFMQPYNEKVDEIFKSNFYYTLLFSVIAYLIGLYTSFFKNNKWKVLFLIFFIIGFSSGIGVILNHLIYCKKFSYLGIASIFYSLPFIAFILAKKVKKPH